MGAVLSVLYVGVPLLIATVIYLISTDPKRKHREGEPPLSTGLIPFLGHAIAFGKSPLQFLNKCRQQFGPVFTVILAGKRMTFVTDPHSYPAFFKNSKTLSFREVADEIVIKVLGAETVANDEEYHAVHRYYAMYLQGKELVPLTDRLQQGLEKTFSAMQPGGWGHDNLFEWTVRAIFFSSIPGFFGDTFGTEQVFQDYRLFDKYFAMPLAGVPKLFLGAWQKASNGLVAATSKLKEQTNMSRFMEAREGYFEEIKMSAQDKGANQIAMVWASQANSIPAAFWSLAYIVKDPDAKKAILEEIQQVLGDYKPGQEPITRDQFKQLIKMESAINEALRLSSGGMSLRYATEDITFHVESTNQDVILRKGDRIAVFPYVSHYDPDIFPEPNKFVWDRFLEYPDATSTETGPTLTKKFYKDGQVVKMALLPFGGGASHCPGRFFAVNEVKMFVLMALLWFDIEVGPNTQVPPLDVTRAGLGTYPPAGDMPFRYRWKATTA